MTATVENIRRQIDLLAPDEARELFRDLQRSYPSLLHPTPSAADENEDEDVASVEAEWDAEIEGRLKDVAEGRVKLITSEEFEQNSDALFVKLGIRRPSR